ncbi:hypothetical protein MA16_Dca007028 [Dendrobium catenatum]|uniref:Uncharacterized protein n=1 Tax=Dendrobium catenatum TaxID=906689 RepID=A0A2I0VX59_9ASPA|nr:hypothetical protein MA16_Dca007028 [Dendrobium catenatum]
MATTTVNDTPPSAIKNGGWFSKFIDPAARLIVSTATHLFTSSIFGKNTNSIQQIPQANSAPQIREQREDFVDITLHFHYNGVIMSEQELISRFDDIFGLEHLIHQKCLTKEEIDCLDRLIQSRIVEPGNYLLLDGNQSKEKKNGDSNTNSKDNLDCSKPPKEPPSTPGLNAAVSADMIRRPYCRSALCRRISCASCKDKNSDLIRPLKWRRPSQFDTSQFVHQRALKLSRSDWNEECFDDGRRRVRQKTCLFQKSFSQFGHQQGLKRSRSDWNEECSDDEERRVRQKTC